MILKKVSWNRQTVEEEIKFLWPDELYFRMFCWRWHAHLRLRLRCHAGRSPPPQTTSTDPAANSFLSNWVEGICLILNKRANSRRKIVFARAMVTLDGNRAEAGH